MCRSFVHLHNHTEYSLLDGACRVKDLVRRAKELEMPAVAITDHGVMFGAMEFYFECKAQGVKPILGMEAYVAPRGLRRREGREDNETYHLLLLARNETGYRNLCKLHSVAALEGYYYKPRIDHELLREHASGLIGTTTCLGSEINQALARGSYEEAKRLAEMYKDMFDEGCYFVELQDHGIALQRQCNEGLLRIAHELKLPTIVTNDAHYLCRTDAEPHDVLLCIGTGNQVDDPKRLRFETQEFFIKTQAEMASLFPDHPEAMENTGLIADMIDLKLGHDRALMPDPELPPGTTPTQHLRNLATQGLRDRLRDPDDRAYERLEYELGIIETTKFENYFLLVREFSKFTRDQGIMFGVRGSAAGSLVSYTLGITDVDPLRWGLTFERFLNPERVSMPDIDMDFEDARRDEVIRWVTERYGKDRVAQIVTFGTLGAKAAIKDAGRVLGYSPQETDRLCKTIPNGPGWSLDRAVKEVGEFRAMLEDARNAQLVETAQRIEGLARHCGVHAAGVVISSDPLDNHIPLYRGNDGQAITAYEMGILEKIGLLKMDFLGLSNLTVLAKTIANIRQTHPKGDDPILTEGHQAIPEGDAKTFEMLARGETVGVFQLESEGMRRNIVELKPNSIAELAAMVALYRPGPMEHIPTYVNNKFGRTQAKYLDERMRPILEETYGVIVYQDQVLMLVRALAGFTLGRADILRRAMGKKDRKIMDAMQTEFLQGAQKNGVDPAVADQVWELLLPFAGYAFNKAHAVCYAILAYQTAYLKANYPAEYLAALLAIYRSKEDKVVSFIDEARRQGIPVLKPDVNRSDVDFTIEQTKKGHQIRFGMGAIKGVGEGLVRAMIAERAGRPFTHLYEFCERLRANGLNKTALEALIKSGALDGIDPDRKKLLKHAEPALLFADRVNRERANGQTGLFGEASAEELPSYPVLPAEGTPDRREILAMEKEVIGLYLSDHPLRGYERAVAQAASHTCSALPEMDADTQVTLAGVVVQARDVVGKKSGNKMRVFTLEDATGQAGCVAYSDRLMRFGALVEKDQVVVIRGTVVHRERPGMERQVEVRVNEVSALQRSTAADVDDPNIRGTVFIRLLGATRNQLRWLREHIATHPGDYQVEVAFGPENGEEPLVMLERVDAANGFVDAIYRNVARVEVLKVENKIRPGGSIGPGSDVQGEGPIAEASILRNHPEKEHAST